jgi:hypothetical protein
MSVLQRFNENLFSYLQSINTTKYLTLRNSDNGYVAIKNRVFRQMGLLQVCRWLFRFLTFLGLIQLSGTVLPA